MKILTTTAKGYAMRVTQEMIDTLTPEEQAMVEQAVDESNESQAEFDAEMAILEDATHPQYNEIMRKYA